VKQTSPDSFANGDWIEVLNMESRSLGGHNCIEKWRRMARKVTVLFDSGASSHNYISERLIEEAGLQDSVEPTKELQSC
jgi:hypothetical protein